MRMLCFTTEVLSSSIVVRGLVEPDIGRALKSFFLFGILKLHNLDRIKDIGVD